MIIGADGYRSLVRKTVAPQHPYAPYGGFLLWRGLVEESWLPERFLAQRSLGGGRLPHPETARLVVYRVPGPNGETAPGKRQITFAWYDATRTTWLRDRGYLLGNEVMASVPNGAIDADLHNQLRTLIATRWRGAAREVLTTAIAHKVIFGTPLAEYLPEQLVAGRVGIVGDAAHVASPMVGAGFSSGLVDGAVFIAAVKDCGGVVAEAGVEALRRYEKERLEPNRDRVLESHEQTLDLLRSTR